MIDGENPGRHDQDSEPGSAPAGAAAASDTAGGGPDAGAASVPAGATQPADTDPDEQLEEAAGDAGDADR